MPAYNAEPYLARAIESCLRQTEPPEEIIVVDDGSRDRTAEVAESFPAPVRVIRMGANQGVSAARNRGVRESTGDWLAFLDADDWFLPQKLEWQRKCIRENPNAVLVYTGFHIINLDGEQQEGYFFSQTELAWRVRYHCPILLSTSVLRREAFDAVEGFDPAYPAAQDWDLWLRLAARYSVQAFAAVKEPLAVYRKVQGSLSSSAMRYLVERASIIESRSLFQTSGLPRWLLGRRIHAFNYFDTAVAVREEGSDRYLEFMLRSLALWPLPGRMLPMSRYKTALVMCLQTLGWRSNPFRQLRPPAHRHGPGWAKRRE